MTPPQQETHRPQISSAESDYFEMRGRESSVPRHRNHIVEDRPGTASSSTSVSRDWFHSSARTKRKPRRPPISSGKPGSLVSLSTVAQISTQVEDEESELGTLVGIRGCNGSSSSVGSTRFKDLLDAQDEIRPTDFRSRVEATGVREHCEDVADRNILRYKARDIHAMPSPLPVNNGTKPLSSTGSCFHLKPAYTKGQVLGTVLRETPSLDEVGAVSSFSRRNKQRLSLNTYVPRGITSPISPRYVNTPSGLSRCFISEDFAIPSGRSVSAGRNDHLSPATSNFSASRSPWGAQRTVLEWKEFLSQDGIDHLDDKPEEDRVHEDIVESDLSSYQGISNRNLSHTSLSRYPQRQSHQSHQSLRSSLASSVVSRPPSLEITPLAWPKPRNDDTANNTKGLSNDLEGAEGRTQSACKCMAHIILKYTSLTLPASRHQSRSNSIEDQHSCHGNKTLNPVSCPPGVTGQVPARPSSARILSSSEMSKSESTASFNAYSTSSGRPCSRHTASTSLDSTNYALSTRQSEESSLSANNCQRGSSSGGPPATSRSTDFNIYDYVSSDDDSFATARKGSRITAEGEEDLLFKPGYGITGAALPGLEELAEEAVYSVWPPRETKRDSMSSDGSAAIAAGPIDNRFDMAREIPTQLRQVRSDPELELYSGTFGRSSMRNGFKDFLMSTSEGEEGIASSDTVEFDEYLRPLPCTTTACSENGVNEEELSTRRGLSRLSALGNIGGINTGSSDARPSSSAADMAREEQENVETATAFRLRKEEKARKRTSGLQSAQEKRKTKMFGEVQGREAVVKPGSQPDDGDENWDRGRKRDKDDKGKEVTVE